MGSDIIQWYNWLFINTKEMNDEKTFLLQFKLHTHCVRHSYRAVRVTNDTSWTLLTDMEDKTCQWPQSVTAVRYFTKIRTHKVDMMFIDTCVCIQACTPVVKLECPKNNNIDNKLYWCCTLGTPDCLSNKFHPQWSMSPGRADIQLYIFYSLSLKHISSLLYWVFVLWLLCYREECAVTLILQLLSREGVCLFSWIAF